MKNIYANKLTKKQIKYTGCLREIFDNQYYWNDNTSWLKNSKKEIEDFINSKLKRTYNISYKDLYKMSFPIRVGYIRDFLSGLQQEIECNQRIYSLFLGDYLTHIEDKKLEKVFKRKITEYEGKKTIIIDDETEK